MRPKGSAELLEERRLLAVRMLDEGLERGEVAGLLGVDPTTVSKWKARADRGGADALRSRPNPGAAPRLTPGQLRRLARLLAGDPTRHGFPTSLWTGRRVAALIRRRFGVRYHPGHAWRLLRRLGLTPQKPQTPARERDEARVRHWRHYRWPAVKKKRRGRGGTSCSSTRAGSCSSRSAAAPGPRAGTPHRSRAGTAGTGGA